MNTAHKYVLLTSSQLSTEPARLAIDQYYHADEAVLAGRGAALVTLIAETGGQNVMLHPHEECMDVEGRLIARVPIDTQLEGHFFPPVAYAIDTISQLNRGVFGPVLHIIRNRARDLESILDEINNTGYGLTLGVHSRIEKTQRAMAQKARVGNCYINRIMTGAVVGGNASLLELN